MEDSEGDVVETSDVEEQAELLFRNQPEKIEHSLDCYQSGPRKRAKFDHDPPYCPTSPFLLNTPLHYKTSSKFEAWNPSTRFVDIEENPGSSPNPSSFTFASSSPLLPMDDSTSDTNLPEPSQDPLLLERKLTALDNYSTSCDHSHDHSARMSATPTAGPDHYDPTAACAAPAERPSLGVRSRSSSVDPLSLFSSPPRGHSTPNEEDSLFTPLPASSPPPMSSLSHRPSDSPNMSQTRSTTPGLPHLSTLATGSSEELVEDQDPIFIEDAPRYQLRQRVPRQIRPYAHDNLVYQQALRSNPDAIVKFRVFDREVRHENYENEESQFQPEEEEDEEPKENLPRHSPTFRDKPRDRNDFQDFLPDLPSTDEEEAEAMRVTSKEAREFQRRKAKEAKEKEANEKVSVKKRVRAFPLSNAEASSSKLPSNSSRHEVPKRRDMQSTSPRASWSHSQLVSGRASGLDESPPEPVVTPDENSPLRHWHHDDLSTELEDDFRFTPPSPTPRSIRSNSIEAEPEDSPHDRGASPSSQSHEEGGIPDTEPEVDAFDQKQKRALKRMWPSFMINRISLTEKQPRKPKRHSSSLPPDESDTEPLLPGQTKVKHAAKGARSSIKGDSESSEGSPDVDHDRLTKTSDSEVEHVYPPLQRRLTTAASADGLSDDRASSSDEGDDDGIGDIEIREYLRDQSPIELRKEQSLIDYMLAAPRSLTTGPHQRRNTFPHSRPRNLGNKTRLEVKTHGTQRHSRQTKLNFDRQEGSRTKELRRSSNTDHISPEREPRRRKPHITHDVDHVYADADAAKHALRKRKEKEKKARSKAQGLYTFSHNDTHLVTGAQKQSLVTVDFAPRRRRPALAPTHHWARDFEPPHHSGQKQAARPSLASPTIRATTNVVDLSASSPPPISPPRRKRLKRRLPEGDSLYLLPFHAGICFGKGSYLGRGRLHELLESVCGRTPPPDFALVTARGFTFDSNIDLKEFVTRIPNVFDSLFDWVTSLPTADSVEDSAEFHSLMHAVCCLASVFVQRSETNDRQLLIHTIEEQTTHLLSRIRDLALPGDSLDETNLAVSWFAVEISARCSCELFAARNSIPATHPLNSAIAHLISQLLGYSFQKTTVYLQDDPRFDEASLSCYVAELWICLFHLLDQFHSPESTIDHPLWSLLRSSRITRLDSSSSNLEASEDIWGLVFGLSALSQFSKHGMTTTQPRLPACWDFVALAFQHIRLTSDVEADQGLSAVSLDKRDQYIALVSNRCHLLCSRWHWQLNNAGIVFNQLLDILKSRKFANLRHEPAEFPKFVLQNDWSLLFEVQPNDTTFVIFWKLLVRAAKPRGKDDLTNIPPKIRKLLSLAIPVGAFPFSKSNPPSPHDLSMLYNRLTSVAVAIYLDPNYVSRIPQARDYITFTAANDMTRFAIIRGIMNFANLMVSRGIALTEIAAWIQTLSEAVTNELKEYTSGPTSLSQINMENDKLRDRLVICSQMLIAAVRNIVDSHKNQLVFPTPGLLLSLNAILKNSFLTQCLRTTAEIQLLVLSFLDARAAVLPPPERPRVFSSAAETNQDSQEDYGPFSLDLDDPALLEALDGGAQSSTLPDHHADEEALFKAVEFVNVYWLTWRSLKRYTLEPPTSSSFESRCQQVDRWISAWVGSANINIRYGQKITWGSLFDVCIPAWSGFKDESWGRRLRLSVMHTILLNDPMAYVTHQDQFIGVFVECLASVRTSLEPEYIRLLADIDGLRHCLLRGSPIESNSFTAQVFDQTRLQIVEALLSNLNQSLIGEAEGDLVLSGSNQTYIGFILRFFSVMRYSLLKEDLENREKCLAFCRHVFQAVQQHAHLRMQERLKYWIEWARTLG